MPFTDPSNRGPAHLAQFSNLVTTKALLEVQKNSLLGINRKGTHGYKKRESGCWNLVELIWHISTSNPMHSGLWDIIFQKSAPSGKTGRMFG